ncbi:AI-2E family transporter [Sandaracinobacter sp. RS1-74]|uniref:AI-2E family transporter n=1 Tax=Sandaracinobacteroides sayramensis TaxID=2913411 RepID=UPI001ED9E018|nr:AI-2E family transporter [Sandaracinobacteroides sayramensis]
MTASQIGRGEFAVRVGIAVLIVALAFGLWRMHDILLLVFAGVLVGIILNALAHRIERFSGLGHRMALAAATLSLFGLIGALFYFFGHEIAAQLGELGAKLPAAWDDLRRLISASGYEAQVNAQLSRSVPSGGTIIAVLGNVVTGVSGAISGLLLATLGGIYLAAQPGVYQTGVLMLFPPERADALNRAIGRTGYSLRAWLKGQLISMLFTATAIMIGLAVIGVPTPVALGLIAGIAGFIPMIGPLIGAAVGILVALTIGGTVLWSTILLYLVVQQLAGSVIEPLIMQHTVKVPPALTLFGLLAVGALLGPIGVLLGGPILVASYVLTRELYVKEALGRPLED